MKDNEIRRSIQSPPPLYVREEKKLVSRLGWRLVLLVAVMLAVANIMTLSVGRLAPDFLDSSYYLLLMNFVAQYCVAFPLCIWLMSRLPKVVIRERSLSFADGVRLFIIGWFLMFLGSWLSMGVETFMSQAFGITMPDMLEEFLDGADWLASGLLAVVLAPIFEELVFRKLLLDRLVKYGELPAVLASGILFGLYHGNFQQLFYAVFIGILFAYIYVKTGRIRYSVILHMLVNFQGMVISPWLLVNEESVLAFVYILVQLAMIITGLVLLIQNRRRVHFAASEYDINSREGAGIIWLNPGMLAALLITAVVFILNLMA